MLSSFQYRESKNVVNHAFKGLPGSKGTLTEQFKHDIANEIRQLKRTWGRRVFQGDVALTASFDVGSEDPTPAHLHSQVKNLLDLYSERPKGISRIIRPGFYLDDSQIKYLAVNMNVGWDLEDRTRVKIIPYRDFLENIHVYHALNRNLSVADLVKSSSLRIEAASRPDNASRKLDDAEEDLRLTRSILPFVPPEGRDLLELVSESGRQEAELNAQGLSLHNVESLLGQKSEFETVSQRENLRELTFFSAFPIALPMLPTLNFRTPAFKSALGTAFNSTKEKYSFLANLAVPVGFQIAVKPQKVSSESVTDLDNIARLISPAFMDAFKPSPIHATTNLQAEGSDMQHRKYAKEIQEKVPKGLKSSYISYEIFILPDTSQVPDGHMRMALRSASGPVSHCLERTSDILWELAHKVEDMEDPDIEI